MSGNSLYFQILGPLRMWRDGAEIDSGPRQQGYLFALLLARAGSPINTTELVELIWGEHAPPSARNIIHKYVGALRRILEPELPLRGVGSYLRRRGDAYVFTAGQGALDLATFRQLVTTANARRADQCNEAALDRYLEALRLWRGPTGTGWDHGPLAMSIVTAIDDEFFAGGITAAELSIALGQPERALPHLQLAAAMAPLHEAVQASLITVLAAAGRQAEALDIFHTVRARLADDLGIDPGPTLEAALQRVLRPSSAAPTARPAEPSRHESPAAAMLPSERLIGRTEELALLSQAVGLALTGSVGLAIIHGEPGAGKTRLLHELATDADKQGVLVVWGHCLDGDGTPAMWPWTQAITAIVDAFPASEPQMSFGGQLNRLIEPELTSLTTSALADGGAQFRLFEQVVDVVSRAAARQPILLAIDDLQWADPTSLDLFAHLAARLPVGCVLVGALRDRAPALSSALSHLLAMVSRVGGHRRVQLGRLTQAEVTELIHRDTGRVPRSTTARAIHDRTAGNPFFVRELSRMLTVDGTLDDEANVPSTVHDIVRDRMSVLDDDPRLLLQIGALIGREVDLSILAYASGLEIAACLEFLEPLRELALLEPVPLSPFTFQFTHDLVRESIAATTPSSRAPRLHLRIADAMRVADPDGEFAPERLAHHLWSAGPLADPDATARALERAGRQAAAKSALPTAERHLQAAAHVARKAGLAELELAALSLLTAVIGMRSAYTSSAVDLLERAEQLARSLGRELEATDFLYSRRAGHSMAAQLDRSGPLSRQLLEHGEASLDPIVRAYGLHSWGIHQWDIGNIGEAFRYLSQLNQVMLEDLPRHEDNRLRHDLQFLSPVMLAMMTALHGNIGAARELLDTVEVAAGDDPFAVTVWAAFAATTAALAGDAEWALRVAERGIAHDPDFAFVYLGTYSRLARCWAAAMSGPNPGDAALAAEKLIATYLMDPPLSGVSNWYGLLGEMWLVAGDPSRATVALDRAEHFLNVTGQRYAEGLLVLLRARLHRALGEHEAAMAAAEQARALSATREAHLFVHRADEFLAELDTG